jgi:hypothetical protein
MLDNTDREISALEARVKLLRKQKITLAEKQSIKWLADREWDESSQKFLKTLPKNVYCDLAGRARKTLDEQAEAYNLPLRKPALDMYEIVRVLHDRLIEFAESARLAETSEASGLKEEKLRQEIRRIETQNAILQVDLARKNSELTPRETVREALQWLTGQLLGLGSKLAKDHGELAQAKLNDFLDSMAYEIENGVLNL